MKSLKFIIVFITILMVTSCATKKVVVLTKPEASNMKSIVDKSTTSFINMPIEITLSEIQNRLNESLSHLIYEDTNIEDDDTEMKIWKTSTIQIEESNGKIKSKIPLKIWIKVKYGSNFLGISNTKELNFNGVITLNSNVRLSNWKMNTSSTIEKIEWSESPNIVVAGKKIPITYIINPTLLVFKESLAAKIDDAINESCDFKPFVLDVLETLSAPIETSEDFEAWFKMIPIEVYVTDAVLQKNKVLMNLGLKCNMQTLIGQKPETKFNKTNISFKPVTYVPNATKVSIAAASTYTNASRIITKNFKGQEFGSGSKKVSIQNVELWHKNGKLIVALNLKGSIDGVIYLSGVPVYNPETKEIYVEQLEYILETKGLLTKTANWLLQGYFLRKMEENCRFSIESSLEETKSKLLPYLNNFSPQKGVFVNGTIEKFDFEKMEFTNEAIFVFLNGSGTTNILIKEGL